MGRKDNQSLLSLTTIDELTACDDLELPPAAAENALEKAKTFIELGLTKKSNISNEQKQMIALMRDDTGAIETIYKDTDSQFDKLDERELAKTLGEEHLDMSVVATIVQDKDRFEKIAPQIREKIMIFILKERLKGRYFLLVDTDHFRVPARNGALFYKRIRRSIFYALLFLLLGITWLRWLDGDMVEVDNKKKRFNMPTTKRLTTTIAEMLLNETSAYLRSVYISKVYDKENYPDCKLKFMSHWSQWEEDMKYIFEESLPPRCGLRQYVRHRLVLIERKPSKTYPKTSLVKCPPSHEIQFNYSPCCATKETPAALKAGMCFVQIDVSMNNVYLKQTTSKFSPHLDNACVDKKLKKFESATEVFQLRANNEGVLIYSGYTAELNNDTGMYESLEQSLDFNNYSFHPSHKKSIDTRQHVFLVFSMAFDNSMQPYLISDTNNKENKLSISVVCEFSFPNVNMFKKLVLSTIRSTSEYEKDWDLFEKQILNKEKSI